MAASIARHTYTADARVSRSLSSFLRISLIAAASAGPLARTPVGAFAVYGVGRFAGWNTVADVGLHTTEALVLTVGVSEAIRGPLGRASPRIPPDDQYSFFFWGGFTDFGKRSYPSIHAAVAFATATA